MMLEKLYLKAYAGFGKGRFSVSQFTRLLGLSTQSSKVLIHRLKKNGQLLRVKHGEHVLLSPESFLRLTQLAKKDRMLHCLAVELFEMFPELKALILYGSHVRGDVDRYSDYDVMLILPKKTEESRIVRQKIEKKLGITLHLTIYSEKGYHSAVLAEPYIRFWLAEGIVFDEASIIKTPIPPIPKIAYEEWQSTAESYMKTAHQMETKAKKGRYYLTALEILELVKAALVMRYDFSFVKAQLVGLVGKETIKRLRAGRQLGSKELKLLEKACKKELKTINAILSKMGENEADIYWKEQLEADVLEVSA